MADQETGSVGKAFEDFFKKDGDDGDEAFREYFAGRKERMKGMSDEDREAIEKTKALFSFENLEFKDDFQEEISKDCQELSTEILRKLIYGKGKTEDFKNFYILLRELHHLLILGSSDDPIRENSRKGLKFLAISADSLVLPNRQVASNINDFKRKVLETLPKDFKFGAEGSS